MNKRLKRNLEAFRKAQQGSPLKLRYVLSQRTAQEQALAEHVQRGYTDPRRYDVLSQLAALDQELGLLDKANKI